MSSLKAIRVEACSGFGRQEAKRVAEPFRKESEGGGGTRGLIYSQGFLVRGSSNARPFTFQEEEKERTAVYSHSFSQSLGQVMLSAIRTECTPEHQHHFISPLHHRVRQQATAPAARTRTHLQGLAELAEQ